MNPLAALLTPLLLLPVVPMASVQDVIPDGRAGAADENGQLASEVPAPDFAFSPAESSPFSQLANAFRSKAADQVRIEQHIIIRIAPRPGSDLDPRRTAFSTMPPRAAPPRLEERGIGKCVPVAGIAGVQVSAENRLILMMRDSRVLSAALEKGCGARDFYSGFYVERSTDGMMCTGRDTLQSRTGVSCKLGKMHQLVEADD